MSCSPSSAFARFALAVCLVATVGQAQTERRPEAYELGIGMQSRGLHEEAVKKFQQFLRDHPKHQLVAEGQYRLAQSYLEIGDQRRAIDSLRAAIQRGGAKFALRPEAGYRLGNLLQEAGDHEGALPVFSRLSREIGADHYLAAAARYAQAEVLRDLGRDADAAKAFGAAAKVSVGERAGFLFPSLYQGGFASLRAQDYKSALVAFDRAREVAPDDAARGECQYLVGDAHLRLKQYPEATEAFRAALARPSEFSDDAQYGLGWSALGQEDRVAALAAFRGLIERHPKSSFVDAARLEQARLLYQAKHYDEAQQALRPLLVAGHALQQQARQLQGLCALASGAGAAAVKALEAAIAEAADADQARLHFALGEALANLEQWSEALAAYGFVTPEAGAELYGDASYGACHALHELGRHEDSIAAASKVLDLKPPHRSRALALVAVAENQFALRRYARAEAAYQKLEEFPEQQAAAQWKLAWCRYLQGDKADAASRFQEIAKGEDREHAEEALAMQALALYESGEVDDALAAADRYRARYQTGEFLARTERVAARVLQKKGDLGAAQRRLQRAAAMAKQRGGAEAASLDVVEQADLAYQQGDYATADKLFGEISARPGPVGARALAGRAWCAFEVGDDARCDAALVAAKAHPEAEKELPGLLELQSALRHRQQDWPEAIATARAFLQAYPEHPKAPVVRYALGVALARDGQQKAAREVLAGLLKDGSYADLDRVRYELAWAHRRDGDAAAAFEVFRQLGDRSEDPELAGEARLFVGTALLAEEPPKLKAAAEWLGRVKGRFEKQALYRMGFAELQAAGDRDQELLAKARDRFAAIAALPGEELLGEALFLGAECCRRLGDGGGAVTRCKRLLAELADHERSQRARLLLGECALQTKTPADAIAPLAEFLRRHDASADALARADAARANLWLGTARMRREEYAAAEQCFAKTVKLSAGSLAAEAQFRIGESRAAQGELDGAIDALVKLPILYADPTWVPRGLLRAGKLYLQQEQPAKADVLFRELVEKHQGSKAAAAAADLLKR